MEMLTPGVGWATTGIVVASKLLWTSDGGAHWRNITPNPFINSETREVMSYWEHEDPEFLASVFFLDKRRGWVLLCCGQPDPFSLVDDGLRYDLAMTTDTGATWSIARVKIPADANLQLADNLGGQIEFADPLHGWMNLTGSATHTSWGTLFITSDGGRTWRVAKRQPRGGGADRFRLVTSEEGWQLMLPSYFDPDTTGLYVTRDGARSWQEVSVPIPKKILGAAEGGTLPIAKYFDLPTFDDKHDRKHGFLPVTYPSVESIDKSTLVLFETNDGGRSWKPLRAIKDLPKASEFSRVKVIGSTLIAATGSNDHNITLTEDGPGGRSDNLIFQYFSSGIPGPSHLSFATPKEGWIQGWMLDRSRMFSTKDGGASWKELNPTPVEEKDAFRFDPGSEYPAEVMQLLTLSIGWAFVTNGGSIHWTEDGGTTWKNLVPPNEVEAPGIISVFFLDTKRGWALSDGFVFSTTDAGAHWSTTRLEVPGLRMPFRAYGQISFAEAVHGWISMRTMTYQNGQQDLQNWLLLTSDSGRTWQTAIDTGPGGTISLNSPTTGWMRTYSGDALLVTRDGANTWEQVSPRPPKEVEPGSTATYEMPALQDANQGFLSVTYSGGVGVKAVAVLFTTDDGGRTWKADRTLTGLNSMPMGNGVSSAVVGDKWITANLIGDNNPVLTSIGAGATVNSISNDAPGYYGAHQLSFISPLHGWILVNNDQLLSTSDGGATWSRLNASEPVQSSFSKKPGSIEAAP